MCGSSQLVIAAQRSLSIEPPSPWRNSNLAPRAESSSACRCFMRARMSRGCAYRSLGSTSKNVNGFRRPLWWICVTPTQPQEQEDRFYLQEDHPQQEERKPGVVMD